MTAYMISKLKILWQKFGILALKIGIVLGIAIVIVRFVFKKFGPSTQKEKDKKITGMIDEHINKTNDIITAKEESIKEIQKSHEQIKKNKAERDKKEKEMFH
ncbi:MAG TPA: hypothetical protein VE912_15730 [Bacteroidales bacterium]|nr:hypothetical protein [Bacteroidales bacterium]